MKLWEDKIKKLTREISESPDGKTANAFRQFLYSHTIRTQSEIMLYHFGQRVFLKDAINRKSFNLDNFSSLYEYQTDVIGPDDPDSGRPLVGGFGLYGAVNLYDSATHFVRDKSTGQNQGGVVMEFFVPPQTRYLDLRNHHSSRESLQACGMFLNSGKQYTRDLVYRLVDALKPAMLLRYAPVADKHVNKDYWVLKGVKAGVSELNKHHEHKDVRNKKFLQAVKDGLMGIAHSKDSMFLASGRDCAEYLNKKLDLFQTEYLDFIYNYVKDKSVDRDMRNARKNFVASFKFLSPFQIFQKITGDWDWEIDEKTPSRNSETTDLEELEKEFLLKGESGFTGGIRFQEWKPGTKSVSDWTSDYTGESADVVRFWR